MAEKVVAIDKLCHTYPGNIVALKDICLEIHQGEFIGIIGQNGAGKTTLVKHFNGLCLPTSGNCIIKGMNTKTTEIAELARTVGYVFQNPDHQIFADSLREEVAFGLRNLGFEEKELLKRVDEALETVGLGNMDKDELHPLTLSKGDRQRLAIASVLAMTCDIFIIDEPTTGQDFYGSEQIMSLISRLNEQGHTIILISHNMRLIADYVSRVIVLSQGVMIFDGTPEEVFSRPDILSQSYLQPPPSIQLAQKFIELGLKFSEFSLNSLELAKEISHFVDIEK